MPGGASLRGGCRMTRCESNRGGTWRVPALQACGQGRTQKAGQLSPQIRVPSSRSPVPAAALLFDGDRIACLSAMLLKDLISALPPAAAAGVRVGIIQTAYANGAASRYIRDNLGCAVEVGTTHPALRCKPACAGASGGRAPAWLRSTASERSPSDGD